MRKNLLLQPGLRLTSAPKKIVRYTQKQAEIFFGTHKDPTQITISDASHRKLAKLHPNTMLYKLGKAGWPISWIIIVPTTKTLAKQFLQGKINEKQMFDRTKPASRYSAFYLCSAITMPRYRRRGYAKELIIQAIKTLPKTKDFSLFAWPFSKEGFHIAKTSKLLGKKILIKS